jgi:predicted nucleic acid-binding protein
MIVLDASAALEILLRAGDRQGLVDRVLRSGETIAAPYLLDVEVAQVLRRFVMACDLAETRARDAMEDHLALGIARYPHDGLLDRVWQLRGECTAYDAASIALAEALDAVLVTCDGRLADVPGTSATFEVFRA